MSYRQHTALARDNVDGSVALDTKNQSYSYEDFIEGYRPTGKGEFELKPGLFRLLCKKAHDDPQNRYVLVIDEINRGNLSKIFGELLLLIEHDKRRPERRRSPKAFRSALDSSAARCGKWGKSGAKVG